ncbi:putative tRNA-dihydrouridine(16/17) synthase (NAD(P)(+)) [Helianthus annuus]|nr:putative tRNA-dihydrouridine(16/17) synthase (NAD(P)(+)) [Helianthus annuus]
MIKCWGRPISFYLFQKFVLDVTFRPKTRLDPSVNTRNLNHTPIHGGDGRSSTSRRLLRIMKFKSSIINILFTKHLSSTPLNTSLMNNNISTLTQTLTSLTTESSTVTNSDDRLCSETTETAPPLPPPLITECSFFGSSDREARIEKALSYWRKLGQPKLIVAPMVDNSELPFRILCRRYGAEAAYSPMLHSRIFSENAKYRSQEFTTCKEDRPLFVQFCANDPETLLEAARRVEACCDYVDINLGCPQRIARRGNYGAFLMDKLPVIKSLVEKLAYNLHVPVSCKIRIFPDLQDTLNYAKMLEDAGCSLLAVHGRTRDEKDGKKIRANWDAIRAVKHALRIPVLANGNIRHMDDVNDCLEHTGADGVLSAESLLENPALFAGFGTVDQRDLVVEYLQLCEKYPVPWRMIRSHVHKMLGEWFRVHPHVREDLNKQSKLSFEFLYDMVNRLRDLGEETVSETASEDEDGVQVHCAES